MSAWFRMEREAPWGDYGQILAHGMTGDGTRLQGEGAPVVTLERTGPFIPPITLPWGEPVVTATARAAIEEAGLTGCRFLPVTVTRCVRLAWQDWDLEAEEPRCYPAGGEPENYILRRKHVPELADALEPLFALDPPRADDAVPRRMGDFLGERTLIYPADLIDPAHHPGTDIVSWRLTTTIVTRRARDVLAPIAGRWIRFEPLTPV
ncbi:MAG: hypothetical protein AAFZ09_06335 [Pseudomonadota bacterium]